MTEEVSTYDRRPERSPRHLPVTASRHAAAWPRSPLAPMAPPHRPSPTEHWQARFETRPEDDHRIRHHRGSSGASPHFPRGGLARGSVVSVDGRSTVLISLLASVTGSGKHAAIIGLPRLGLLAATEMEPTSLAAP